MTVDAERFWSARPRRRLAWREADDGRCIILRPRLGDTRLGHWLAARLPNPYYRIRLDEIGTFVWKACDGETSLADIAERMRRRFGPDVEPAEARLGRFVQTMLRSRLLTTEGGNGS